MSLFATYISPSDFLSSINDTTTDAQTADTWLSSAYTVLADFGLLFYEGQEYESIETFTPKVLGFNPLLQVYGANVTGYGSPSPYPLVDSPSFFAGNYPNWDYHETKQLQIVNTLYPITEISSVKDVSGNKLDKSKYLFRQYSRRLVCPDRQRITIEYSSYISLDDKPTILRALGIIFAYSGFDTNKINPLEQQLTRVSSDDVTRQYSVSPKLTSLLKESKIFQTLLKKFLVEI